jgi:hypothetical protein
VKAFPDFVCQLGVAGFPGQQAQEFRSRWVVFLVKEILDQNHTGNGCGIFLDEFLGCPFQLKIDFGQPDFGRIVSGIDTSQQIKPFLVQSPDLRLESVQVVVDRSTPNGQQVDVLDRAAKGYAVAGFGKKGGPAFLSGKIDGNRGQFVASTDSQVKFAGSGGLNGVDGQFEPGIGVGDV